MLCEEKDLKDSNFLIISDSIYQIQNLLGNPKLFILKTNIFLLKNPKLSYKIPNLSVLHI